MRTSKEIEDRIRFLLVEELDVRCARAIQRLPHFCVHNHRQPLDVRKNVQGQPNEYYNRVTRGPHLPIFQTIGLCKLLGFDGQPMAQPNVEEWGGTICEDAIDAQRCPYFTPVETKETILANFCTEIRDLEWLKTNMPEVHGLVWVLQASRPLDIPWWKKLIYRFLRINLEPLRPIEDPSKLLVA